jgi:hypothetical protein
MPGRIFALKTYYLQSWRLSINRNVVITRFRRLQGSVPQILPPRHACVCMQSSRLRGGSIRPIWNGYFVKVRSAMLVSLNVIVHLGLRIVGGVFSGRYFNLTFDPGVRHVRLRYMPMVSQVQNNSTLAVGLTTKIRPPQWVLDWRVSKNYFQHGWRHPKK